MGERPPRPAQGGVVWDPVTASPRGPDRPPRSAWHAGLRRRAWFDRSAADRRDAARYPGPPLARVARPGPADSPSRSFSLRIAALKARLATLKAITGQLPISRP